MKVTLITSVPLAPPWDQGDKNLAISLARALVDVSFRVLTTSNEISRNEANIEAAQVYKSSLPGLREKLRVYLWMAYQLRQSKIQHRSVNHKASKPRESNDLYHFIYQPSRASSLLLRNLPGMHHLPSLHTLTATANETPFTPELFFASRVVTLSHYGMRTLEQAGVKHVLRIPPGIHVDTWSSLAGHQATYKSRLGLDGHYTILFPGHYGNGQGSNLMVKALPRLIDRFPKARMVFACRLRSKEDRAQEKIIQTAIKEMGLDQAVRFYNTVSDMRTLIGAADLTVLPLESMRNKIDLPTTLIETLAAAKPILISNLEPMSELVNGCPEAGDKSSSGSNQVGLTVPAGDADALADAMIDLLANPDLRKNMGAQGQRFVRQHFDICEVAKQYERIYRELLQ